MLGHNALLAKFKYERQMLNCKVDGKNYTSECTITRLCGLQCSPLDVEQLLQDSLVSGVGGNGHQAGTGIRSFIEESGLYGLGVFTAEKADTVSACYGTADDGLFYVLSRYFMG